MTKPLLWITLLGTLSLTPAEAQQGNGSPSRLDALERRLGELEAELAATKAQVLEGEAKALARAEADPPTTVDPVDGASQLDSFLGRLVVTGYGDLHANFSDARGGDTFDIHRLIVAVGYQFSSWISFSSEIEVEHAFVSGGGGGGELGLEQAFVDLSPIRAIGLRLGRVLTPLGIINWKHEPPSFNGVERPSFASAIIPSTWSSDGVGIFGTPLPWLSYQAYAVGGLDGSKINATKGIRGARIKERPSFNDVAFTARVDLFPFATVDPGLGQTLRVGLASYWGRLDNGNNAKNPGLSGPELHIATADVEYTLWRFDVRAVLGYTRINKARKIAPANRAPSQTLGWYVEFAAHVMPDVWRAGMFSHSDLVLFVRYDDVNTQHRVPATRAPDANGDRRDPRGNRREWTFGITFTPVPNLAIKVDYQLRDDETHFPNKKPADLLNLGVGFQF